MNINRLKTMQDLEVAFRHFNVQLYRFVFARCTHKKELAEELTQDVFIQAWEKKELFDPQKSSLKNWLYVIARNKIIDHFRKKNFEISLEEIGEQIAEQRTDDVETDLIMEDVIKKINMLKDDEQEVIILRYLQELEIFEIANIINKKYSATKVMLYRAMLKLKKICN
jgi:RNA polymerase sigma-70 factor (ECF subfamily)